MNAYITWHGGPPNYPPPTYNVDGCEVHGQWLDVTTVDAPVVNGHLQRTFIVVPACIHEWNREPIDELQRQPFCLKCGVIKP